MAERFDRLRFGGPIGELLAEEQERVLAAFLGPVRDCIVLDVGTGTGRAALVLARRGARVVGVDASSEMLAVARARAAAEGAAVHFDRGDAHALAFPDRAFDHAVSLRFDARSRPASGAEPCVTRHRVVIDALLFSFGRWYAARRGARAAGRPVEAYRVFRLSAVRGVCAAGLRLREIHWQFVLPITPTAFLPRDRPGHRARACRRPAHLPGPGTIGGSVTSYHRRDWFTGGVLARALLARGCGDCACATRAGPDLREGCAAGVGDLTTARRPRGAPAYHLQRGGDSPLRGVRRVPRRHHRRVAPRSHAEAAPGASCSAARRVYGDVERLPRPRIFRCACHAHQRTKPDGSARDEAAALTGVEYTAARPTGIYGRAIGPACCSAARPPAAGYARSGEIFYISRSSPTSSRGCACAARSRGRRAGPISSRARR
jgi:hypothetical protein